SGVLGGCAPLGGRSWGAFDKMSAFGVARSRQKSMTAINAEVTLAPVARSQRMICDVRASRAQRILTAEPTSMATRTKSNK
ncbi:MAG: hypothetical protein AB7U95_22480, partial [Reyranella sp.]